MFVGYDHDEATARLLRYRKIDKKGKTEYQLVFDQTPFYAESGGQIGDTGYLESTLSKVRVIDTKKENDLIIHTTLELPQELSEDVPGPARCRPPCPHQATTTRPLTCCKLPCVKSWAATWQQKGSLVNEKLLRFDFSHFTKVTDEQLREIERLVNERIRQQIPLDERRNVPIAEAKNLGAMALFGEKYGEFVRVITFDRKGYSVELCGGLHVANTGSIGYFKITTESAVGAGVRRIEAVTAGAAEAYRGYQQLDLLAQVRETLGNPQHLLTTLEKQGEEMATLRKQIESVSPSRASTSRKTSWWGQVKAAQRHQLPGRPGAGRQRRRPQNPGLQPAPGRAQPRAGARGRSRRQAPAGRDAGRRDCPGRQAQRHHAGARAGQGNPGWRRRAAILRYRRR